MRQLSMIDAALLAIAIQSDAHSRKANRLLTYLTLGT